MKHNIFPILFILIVSSAFVPMPPSNFENLTSGAWRLVASTIYPSLDTNEVETTNFFSVLDTCFKDDSLIFFSDSSIVLFDTNEGCDSVYSGFYSGFWIFDSTESNVIIRNDYLMSMVYSVQIQLLNADTLQLIYDEYLQNDTFTVTNTYVHF